MSATGWPALAQAHIDARKAFDVRWLLWLGVKTLAGASEEFGLWTGADHQAHTVEGESRNYFGAQGAMKMPIINYATGTEIKSYEPRLAVSPEAEEIVRGYITRFGPAEIHAVLYDSEDMSLLGYRRFFRGHINGSPIQTPPQNGEASISLKLVSSARRGTFVRNGYKSDQSQQIRHLGDLIRQYGDLGRIASDEWGRR